MLSIDQILRLDEGADPIALAGCFGDSYLCTHNPVYRAIRLETLRHGYTFSPEADELACAYAVCPLFCLPVIQQRKRIPYVRNTEALRTIRGHQCEGFQLQVDEFRDCIKANYVLHESAHCLGSAKVHMACDSNLRDSHAEVQRLIAIEAFANSIDWLAAMFAETPTHNLVLSMNCYITLRKEIRAEARQFGQSLGLERLLNILIWSFITINAKCGRLDGQDARICVEAACEDLEPGFEASVRLTELLTGHTVIAEGFVKGTAKMFFRYVGLYDEFERISSRFRAEDAVRDSRLRQSVQRLVAIGRDAMAAAQAPSDEFAASVAERGA